MKKVLCAVLILAITPLFAEEVVPPSASTEVQADIPLSTKFDTPETIRAVALSTFKTAKDHNGWDAAHLGAKSPELLGDWVLRNQDPIKYSEIKNDEFEFGDAKNTALASFLSELSASPLLDTHTVYSLEVPGEIGAYDSANGGFPLILKIQQGRVLRSAPIEGGLIGGYVLSLTSETPPFLKMEKEKAQDFMKERSSLGADSRNVLLSVEFTLVSSHMDGTFPNRTPGLNRMKLGLNSKVKDVKVSSWTSVKK